MSTDTQQHETRRGGPAPLRRFLDSRKHQDGNATTATSTGDAECGQPIRQRQAVACRSYDRPERGTGRPKRQGTGSSNNSESRSGPKRRKSGQPGKSTTSRPDATGISNNSPPKRVRPGYCRCGQPAEAPYFERCEDCFAEDSERWSGKDQSAIIHW